MGIRNKFPARSSLQPEGGLWNARFMLFPWHQGCFYHGMFDKLCVFTALRVDTAIPAAWLRGGLDLKFRKLVTGCVESQSGWPGVVSVSPCRAPYGSVTVHEGFLGVLVVQQKSWQTQTPLAPLCPLWNYMWRLGPASAADTQPWEEGQQVLVKRTGGSRKCWL